MSFCKWFTPFIFFTNLVIIVNSQYPSSYLRHQCSNNGNYTTDSMYHTNLNSLLSSVSSNIDRNGFYHSSVGEYSDRVNAIALCRGDIQLDKCHSCVYHAARELLRLCPYQKQAILCDLHCMVRYFNNSIFRTLATRPHFQARDDENVTSMDQFNQDLRKLFDSLRSQAAHGGPLKKFAAANRTAPDFQTIYGLVQCTPDLTAQDCSNCLIQSAKLMSECCNGATGVRIHTPSCFLRYRTNPFFDNSMVEGMIPKPPVTKPLAGKNANTTPTIIIIIVPIVLGILLVLCIGVFLRRKQKRKREEKLGNDNEKCLQYDFGTIRAATDNFSDANKLGQGGFGIVYKGELSNGQEIAVKRLSRDSGQGDLEFKNEVLLVARLQHRNLVSLLGFSLEGSERILVYEFVPNGSLDHFIFEPIKRPYLDWDRCYKIISGVARGLLYLHEDSRLRIIHRDLKASNVLLDGDMNPKISDFGLARLFVQDETQGHTSRIGGTRGYMAPEYAVHGQFSVKSDVFSFGVLVLEILTGQRINSYQNGNSGTSLLNFAWKNWQEGTTTNVIDPTLGASSSSLQDIVQCLHISLLCVQENAADRPTMAMLVLMLSNFSLTLPAPSQPAFFVSSPDISSSTT